MRLKPRLQRHAVRLRGHQRQHRHRPSSLVRPSRATAAPLQCWSGAASHLPKHG